MRVFPLSHPCTLQTLNIRVFLKLPSVLQKVTIYLRTINSSKPLPITTLAYKTPGVANSINLLFTAQRCALLPLLPRGEACLWYRLPGLFKSLLELYSHMYLLTQMIISLNHSLFADSFYPFFWVSLKEGVFLCFKTCISFFKCHTQMIVLSSGGDAQLFLHASDDVLCVVSFFMMHNPWGLPVTAIQEKF